MGAPHAFHICPFASAEPVEQVEGQPLTQATLESKRKREKKSVCFSSFKSWLGGNLFYKKKVSAQGLCSSINMQLAVKKCRSSPNAEPLTSQAALIVLTQSIFTLI